jgi:hypothetical protein
MTAASQYSQTLTFTDVLPDERSWEHRLLELGMEREAFFISRSDNRSATLEFWEPDHAEALGYLAKLDQVQ